MKGETFSLEYSQKLLIFLLLNWLIPMLCSLWHDLHDTKEQLSHFNSFFNKSSIQFIIYYIGFLALLIVIKPVALTCVSDSMMNSINETTYRNLIPFYRIACYIEDVIYNHTEISPLIQYILASILVTTPYGFYITLLFKNKGHLIRLSLFFLLPIVMEFCKHFISHQAADVEHVLLGVIGGLVGSCLFFLLNSLYNRKKRYDFLEGKTHITW
ncbi:VanZ family protein [Anaerosporobacter sp.]